MKRSLGFFWGLVFVALGIIMLGVNYGWLPSTIWVDFWRFWPVILIVVGLRKLILNDSLFSFVTLIVVALVLTAVFSGLSNGRIGKLGTKWFHTSSTSKTESFSSDVESKQANFKSEISAAGLTELKIEVGHTYNLQLKGADTDKVSVDLTGPKELVDNVSLAPDGTTLTLKDNSESNQLFMSINLEEVKGTVTMPKALALNLRLSGVAKVSVGNHQTALTHNGSGASIAKFTDSLSLNPVIRLSGASSATLARCSGDMSVEISGSGRASASSCEVPKLTAKVSGSGSVDIKAGTIRDLTVESSGGARIKGPKPTGKIDQNSTGVSSVTYY